VESFLALLTRKTGRPVKLTYTAKNPSAATASATLCPGIHKTGAKKDGRLTALKARIVSDGGAYVYLSPWVLLYSMVTAAGPYRIPHVRVDGCTVLTNNIFTSAKPRVGAPQVCFAYESQMDEISRRLGCIPGGPQNQLPPKRRGDRHRAGSRTQAAFPRPREGAGGAGRKEPVKGRIKIGTRDRLGMMSYGAWSSFTIPRVLLSPRPGRERDRSRGVQDIGEGRLVPLPDCGRGFGCSDRRRESYIADTALTPLAGPPPQPANFTCPETPRSWQRGKCARPSSKRRERF